MSLANFVDKLRRYAGFSAVEQREFWIAVLVLALVYSWNRWGRVEFDFWVGLANFVIAFVFAFVLLGVHHFGQRAFSLQKGLKVEHKLWWYGAGIALIASILSQGRFSILAVSGTFISTLTIHRLGRYKYGPQVKDYAMIALMGPLANVVVASLVKSLRLALGINSELIDDFFVFSLAFAAWNLLPLPPLDGSRIVFSSRLLYALVAGSMIGYVLLIQLFQVYSWLLALLIGLALWLAFYLALERES